MGRDAFRLTVVGAGNVRCGSPVLASLATWYPDPVLRVTLYDANEERLDLFHRLGGRLFDQWNKGATLLATSDLNESLADADVVILSLHEDCARRMTGPVSIRVLEAFEEERLDAWEMRRGDRNRPTRPDQLSEQTRQILAVPAPDHRDREGVLQQAIIQTLDCIPLETPLLSLMRGVLLPEGRAHTFLNWPATIPEDQQALVPHQILRWIYGDEPMDDLVAAGRDNPCRAWMDQLI